MTVRKLPPKPDPATGLPCPPVAPLDSGLDNRNNERTDRFSTPPDPPAGQGPTLEWTAGSWHEISNASGLLVLLLIACMTADDWGFDWMESQGIWLYLIFVAVLPVLIFFRRAGVIVAGAVWLRCRRKWVKTYELVEICLDDARSSATLVLKDTEGRKLKLGLAELQVNPDLWDLVYNGILHSVHNGGAAANERARERLQLDM